MFWMPALFRLMRILVFYLGTAIFIFITWKYLIKEFENNWSGASIAQIHNSKSDLVPSSCQALCRLWEYSKRQERHNFWFHETTQTEKQCQRKACGVLGKLRVGQSSMLASALLPAGDRHLTELFALWELSFLINKRVRSGYMISKLSSSPGIWWVTDSPPGFPKGKICRQTCAKKA